MCSTRVYFNLASFAQRRVQGGQARAAPAQESVEGCQQKGTKQSWLYTMINDFVNRLQGDYNGFNCEHFVEFLIDLESQLPTRRYVNSLLHDLNLLTVIRCSSLYSESALLRDLFTLLRHYMHFPVDDSTATQLSPTEVYELHCAGLAKLQRVALKNFRDKLTILALSNYASIDDPDELRGHLSTLNDSELERLLDLLGFRTRYSDLVPDRHFLTDVLVEAYGRRPTFQDSVRKLSILPTEVGFFFFIYSRPS